MSAESWVGLAAVVVPVVLLVIADAINTRIRLRMIESRIDLVEANASKDRESHRQLREDLHRLVIELREFIAGEKVRHELGE